MMRPEEIHEVIAYVDRLIEATKRGDILWISANPTTYIWESGAPQHARIVIQRVNAGPHMLPNGQVAKGSSYQLQVLDVRKGKPMLSVNSDEVLVLGGKFEELFETAISSINRKGLDYLKSILPS